MASFSIHVFVKCKIKLLEMKLKKSVGPVPSSCFTVKQLNDISFIQNRAISDFFTNILSILSVTLLIVTTTLVNKMEPTEVSKYPNFLLVYFLHFAIPLIFSGTIIFLYFVRHQPLRSTIYREAKSCFGL